MPTDRPVVIACVTFETAKVVEPIIEYESRDVYLFHYIANPEEDRGKVYGDFYNEVVAQLKSKFPGMSITECCADPLWDLALMIKDISNIVSDIRRYEPKRRILINVSAGTSEFGIAGVVVSTRCENVDFFTVHTKKYSVPIEKVVSTYYQDGKPVGLTEHCYKPVVFDKFDMFYPDENVIRGLRAFIHYYDEHSSSLTKDVIAELQRCKIISPDVKWDVADYERHFKREWLRMGWIEKDEKVSRRYKPTDRGRRVAETFFTK